MALHAVCMLKSFLSCLVMLRDHGGSSVSKSTVSCANLIHLDLNPRGVPMGAMKSDPHIVAHQAKGNVRKQCGAFMSLLNLHQSLVVCRMVRVIHPASRGVAAHTASLFRSVRGAKGPVEASQAREFSLFPRGGFPS